MAKTKNFIYEKYLGKEIHGILIDSFNSFSTTGHGALVNCICHCGEKFVTYMRHMLTGNTKSCGCSRNVYKKHGELIGAVYTKILSGAKDRNLSVLVDMAYLWELFLKQNRKCALSGIPITLPKTGKDYSATASVDRIDSNLGYENGNIQWVHKEINFMKQEYSQERFLLYCKAIVEYQESKCQTNFQQDSRQTHLIDQTTILDSPQVSI